MARLYLVTLAKNTPSPFAPENDVVKISTGYDKKEEESVSKKSENADIKIDVDGIQSRIISLQVTPGYYVNLQPVNGRIYYTRFISGSRSAITCMFDLKTGKETELGSDLRFTISSNQKKMLVRKDGKYAVIDLPQGNIELKETIDLSNMMVEVNYREEWKQIFDESWRQMRDFFYVPNMHGVD